MEMPNNDGTGDSGVEDSIRTHDSIRDPLGILGTRVAGLYSDGRLTTLGGIKPDGFKFESNPDTAVGF